jgi:hypothetical protein
MTYLTCSLSLGVGFLSEVDNLLRLIMLEILAQNSNRMTIEDTSATNSIEEIVKGNLREASIRTALTQIWEEGTIAKQKSTLLQPWFTATFGETQQATHVGAVTGYIRVAEDGSPLPIERERRAALAHNEGERKAPSQLEANAKALTPKKEGEDGMVIFHPQKAQLLQVAVQDGEAGYLPKGDSHKFVYLKSNKPACGFDVVVNFPVSPAPESGESKQGHETLRKGFRNLLLSNLNEDLEEYAIAVGGEVEEGEVDIPEFYYKGTPAKDLINNHDEFALVYMEVLGTLQPKQGKKPPFRRFDVSHVRAYILPEARGENKGGNSRRATDFVKAKKGQAPPHIPSPEEPKEKPKKESKQSKEEPKQSKEEPKNEWSEEIKDIGGIRAHKIFTSLWKQKGAPEKTLEFLNGIQSLWIQNARKHGSEVLDWKTSQALWNLEKEKFDRLIKSIANNLSKVATVTEEKYVEAKSKAQKEYDALLNELETSEKEETSEEETSKEEETSDEEETSNGVDSRLGSFGSKFSVETGNEEETVTKGEGKESSSSSNSSSSSSNGRIKGRRRNRRRHPKTQS